MHEAALITVRMPTSPASTGIRDSLDDEQVGSNIGQSRFSARFSCKRVRQGYQDRGKIARTVSNQWSRMSVVGLNIIPECVSLVNRRHIHGALSAALCRHSVGKTARSASLHARSDRLTSHGRQPMLAADGSRPAGSMAQPRAAWRASERRARLSWSNTRRPRAETGVHYLKSTVR